MNIEAGALFGSGRQIEIGDHSSIGVAAQVYGPMTICANVMMGPEVVVITLSHDAARTEIPMIDQGSTQPKAAVIENDVWIAQRVTLLPGVTIGTGAIVGTNAVATRGVSPFSVVAGYPAKEIRTRRPNDGKILDVGSVSSSARDE